MSNETFCCEGDYWTVRYAGVTNRLRDSKGLRYLGLLLADPGTPVSSWDLLMMATPAAANGSSFGKGGGDSKESAAAAPSELSIERARVTVTKSIKSALVRIREHNPELADHLEATVRRGYDCVYRPDPRVPIVWDVGRAQGERGRTGISETTAHPR